MKKKSLYIRNRVKLKTSNRINRRANVRQKEPSLFLVIWRKERRSINTSYTLVTHSIAALSFHSRLTNGILLRFGAFERQLLGGSWRQRSGADYFEKGNSFLPVPILAGYFLSVFRRGDGTLPSGSLLNPQYDSGESSLRFSSLLFPLYFFYVSVSRSPFLPASSRNESVLSG